MKVGIIGAGWIACKMGETLQPHPEMRYAIAARDLGRAQEFAKTYGFQKAYGSYEELVKDPEVELVYIATPHSHHYAHTKLALMHDKPVLCEKAFMANARETEEILNLAHQRNIFITEAIWTRYMPLSITIKEILNSGVIGRPRLLNASLCYQMENKERIVRPDLCGGALLDLGVYSINFARMYFGGDILDIKSNVWKCDTGMDMLNAMSIVYKDGRMANIQSAACCYNDRHGVISCEQGWLTVDNINCPMEVKVYNNEYQLIQTHKAPENQITGYEYQVYACQDAMRMGMLESPYMPHAETLKIMQMMDNLRKEWGVVYPMD